MESKTVKKEFEMVELQITISLKFYKDLEDGRKKYNEQYNDNIDISEYLETGHYDLIYIISKQAEFIKQLQAPKVAMPQKEEVDHSYQ